MVEYKVMATVRYFWHGFINTGTTFMCRQYSRTLMYHHFHSVWKASYTISAFNFVEVPYLPIYRMDEFIPCVVPGPSRGSFTLAKEIVIAWIRISWLRRMFQNLPLPATQEVRDSSNVTPCIVMKKCHRFLLSYGRKMELQGRAVVGRVYHLPWRYSVVQYYPVNVIRHNEHHLHNTLCRAQFLWRRRIGVVCTEVVLNGIPAFPERFTPRATVRYGNAASPHASRYPWKHTCVLRSRTIQFWCRNVGLAFLRFSHYLYES